MAYECNHIGCDGATSLQKSREDTDADVVVEQYECEYGHTFHESLEL